MSAAERDNDGFGKCPVGGCAGYVVGGTCEVCGEDFSGPEWRCSRCGDDVRPGWPDCPVCGEPVPGPIDPRFLKEPWWEMKHR